MSTQLPLPANSRKNYDAVQEFFDSEGWTFKKHQHSESTKSRTPGPWDQHLDASLRLKRIIKVPGLVDDLKNLAQSALDKREKIPTITSHFPTSIARKAALKKEGVPALNGIKNESDLQRHYQGTTATFCSTVAATLELQLDHWDSKALQWVINYRDGETKYNLPATEEPTNNKAIADGFLKVPINSMNKQLAQIFRELPKPVITAWEFKNMRFVDKGEPKKLVNLANSDTQGLFEWVGCGEGYKCLFSNHSEIGTTGARVGPDSNNDDFLPSIMEGKKYALSLEPTPLKTQRLVAGKGQDKHKPVYIMQQTWGEGTVNDVTFMVLHFGNHEIILYRDRNTQTLYISDIVEVAAPGYWKLHTGLYMASIRDALRRANLISNGCFDEQKWERRYQTVIDWSKVRKSDIRMKAWEEVWKNRDWIGLELEERIQTMPRPFRSAGYLRNNNESLPPVQMPLEDTSLARIVIIHPFDRNGKALGVIRFPKAKLPEDAPPIEVFVKISDDKPRTDSLKRAMAVYVKMNSEQKDEFLPLFYGYYEYFPFETEGRLSQDYGPWGALIVQRIMGTSIEDRLQKDSNWRPTQQQSGLLIKALKKIHEVGYVLPQIAARHLIIHWQGSDVFIVGFERAVEVTAPDQCAQNMARLEAILLDPGSRRMKDRERDDFAIDQSQAIGDEGRGKAKKVRDDAETNEESQPQTEKRDQKPERTSERQAGRQSRTQNAGRGSSSSTSARKKG